MRRLAMLFAMLATVHMAEVLVTPQRIAATQTVASRVLSVVRMILAGWRRMPAALTQRQV